MSRPARRWLATTAACARSRGSVRSWPPSCWRACRNWRRLDPHRLNHRQLASLAGLAPHASDSGIHRGKRKVWGGRAEVRRALYIAAKSASTCDPVYIAFRKRLTDAGKPFKVAIIACARKMLTILAAMFRTGQNYKKAPA